MAKLPTLSDLAAFTRRVEGEYIGGLTAQERQAADAPDDWAAKDLLAHVTTWRERGAEELKVIHQGPLPPEAKELDEVNRAIFDENHGQAWEVVQRRAKASWVAYIDALGGLNEDLLGASATADQADRPLWRRVTVDAGNHPVLHYAEFARRRDRTAAATRWMEGAAPLLLAVDPADEWHGVVRYNLACYYAQIGMPDKALDSLRMSLELNPGLVEWSRQDSDLTLLHQDPRFLALFATAA